jgi:hypothetical protein
MIARVYQAINAVAAALAENGVAKTRLNARDNYLYRSIDDVLQRLAPLLAQHRLCILPRVLEREASERQDENGGRLLYVSLRVAFDLVSAEDGSSHTIEAFGEALDASDKGTAKAMQSAFKYAVLQAFCVPAVDEFDADSRSHRLSPYTSSAEPAAGWRRCCDETAAAAQECSDEVALGALKAQTRSFLSALQKANPALYKQVGEVFARRTRKLKKSDLAGVQGSESGRKREQAENPTQGEVPDAGQVVPAAV